MIIAGERSCGQVDGWGGEHAHTRFAHLFFLPFGPLKSYWVTTSLGPFTDGFEIQTHRRSVVAAYLRWYGPILGVAALVRAPLVLGLPAACVLAALVAWSWSWATVRGVTARRHSDYHLLAFGSRCPPERLLGPRRAELAASLGELWARLSSRSPEDVARFGPADAREGVVAYGLLRLAAIARTSGDAGALADRLARGDFEPAPIAGPYRGGAASATELETGMAALLRVGKLDVSDLAEAEAADAAGAEWDDACGDPDCDGVLEHERCTVCGASYDDGEAAHAARVQQRADAELARARARAVGRAHDTIIGGGLLAAAGAVLAVSTWIHTSAWFATETSLAQIASWSQKDSLVEVTCDQVTPAGETEIFTHDRDAGNRTEVVPVVLCAQGPLALPVASEAEIAPDQRTRRGTVLPETSEQRAWFAGMPAAPDAKLLPYYLVPATRAASATLFVLGNLVMFLIGLGVVGAGFRARRRARAA